MKLENNCCYFFCAVQPKSVEVVTNNGQPVLNGSSLGPLYERTRTQLTCVVKEGKPQPKVVWLFNGKEKLDAQSRECASRRRSGEGRREAGARSNVDYGELT
ncbi:hypothetical protein EVAR_53861_1 [Eumeta japonica]|uniref:Ig-like domain-containing protein n=1 Tax=Eumeta variegata TaxID=151549 RepID=A0A4C1XFX0_EUMVA|nr:hypothetical protein EVAR_53861_1 [Eumeta japonica]